MMLFALCMMAQGEVLTLDSCRSRALVANKKIGMAKMKHQMAVNVRKAARTKYLPHIDLAGGYMYSSREISLLSDAQKSALGSMGSVSAGAIGQVSSDIGIVLQRMAQGGVISPTTAHDLGAVMQTVSPTISQSVETYGNELGQRIVDAFSTNTHHLFTASAVMVQPIFMGGAITAGNRMADLAEHIAETDLEAKESDVAYSIDNTYWTVVSLSHKQSLANDYLALVQKLNDDVHKMIREGVATRADGLKVDVAVNEAEMTKTKVDNALSLARMYLCQQCGMALDSNVILADEQNDDIAIAPHDTVLNTGSYEGRHELLMLGDAIEVARQQAKMVRAAYMPQLSLIGGAFFTNPSVYNGFERKFKGALNVGVMMRVPVLDWGDNAYKLKAAKCATNLARLTYDEAHDMIALQVAQNRYKVSEAEKNLVAARNNIKSAEENLRCANLGFHEGVMSTTDVMAAQTAWLKAKTQKIDAEIDAKMSEIALEKALGVR